MLFFSIIKTGVQAIKYYQKTPPHCRIYKIDISRASMSNWVLKSAELLKPFYNRLLYYLIIQKIIQADETTLRVINDGRENTSKSYMWLYQSGDYAPEYPVVLYEYQPTCAGQHAKAVLT